MLRQLLFSFRGRTPRRQFWFFALGFIVLAVLVITLAAVVMINRTPGIQQEQLDVGLRRVMNGFLLVMLWPTLAVCAKRLHDRNYSAWWLVLVFGAGAALVYAMAFLKVAFGTGSIPVYSASAGLALLLIWFIGALGLRPGTVGPNRFGEDPGGVAATVPGDA